ncbi:MAG: DUF2306 domain-containing protein [Pseudomonadota bacterium]|nr:DUF2306 domain-containing protein [Pseudomonadota bacterium]
MTTAINAIRQLPIPFIAKVPSGPLDAKSGFDLSPRMRAIIWAAAIMMCSATTIALFRGFTGLAPAHGATRHLAIVIHVATVLPAVPLGAYLLLTRKGTRLHKQLGKLWVGLMVTTATAAIFIKSGGSFSFIHIFVPMTYIASYKIIATARRGDMKGHRYEVVSLYLGALMIPGIFSIALQGRLLNVWLFG